MLTIVFLSRFVVVYLKKQKQAALRLNPSPVAA